MKLVARAEQQMIFKRIIEIWKVVIKYDCIESVDCMRDLYIIGTLLGMQKDIDRVRDKVDVLFVWQQYSPFL